jgi:hypothetical protein
VRSLSASDTTLFIQVPTWIGLVLVAAAIAVAAGALLRKPPRPWRLGAFLAAIALLYAGWYSLATVTTFEPRGFVVEGMRGEEERVGWLQVRSIDARQDYAIFLLRNSSEVTVDLGGLAAEEKARIVAFVKDRLKR